MIHEPGTEDHRLTGCERDGTCRWLHHWPTADITHTRMTLPAPLLAAFQELFDHEEGLFGTEDSYMCEYTDDGSYWYGLDMPHVTSIWMRVADEGIEPTN